MISVAREKAFLSNKAQAVQKNLFTTGLFPGPCDCSRSVPSRNIRGFRVSDTYAVSYRERCQAYVNVMGGKASFTSGTCRLKAAFNLCLTSLQDTLPLAVGGQSTVTRAVVISLYGGVPLPPTGWPFMTTGERYNPTKEWSTI